jgi:hypothetical protein
LNQVDTLDPENLKKNSKKMFGRFKKNNKKKNLGNSKACDLGKTIQQDPLMEYGFGVVAYRNILKYMCLGFTILSLLQIPIVSVYG